MGKGVYAAIYPVSLKQECMDSPAMKSNCTP